MISLENILEALYYIIDSSIESYAFLFMILTVILTALLCIGYLTYHSIKYRVHGKLGTEFRNKIIAVLVAREKLKKEPISAKDLVGCVYTDDVARILSNDPKVLLIWKILNFLETEKVINSTLNMEDNIHLFKAPSYNKFYYISL